MFHRLKEKCAQLLSLENPLFWEDLNTLRSETESGGAARPPSTLQLGLRRLYEAYIPPGSPRELNVSAVARQALKADYDSNGLSVSSFERAREEVYQMLCVFGLFLSLSLSLHLFLPFLLSLLDFLFALHGACVLAL
jgi:hypothetical protein